MSEPGPQQRPDLMNDRADVLEGGEASPGGPDVMGGPQPSSDVMTGGRVPDDEGFDVMRRAGEPADEDSDVMRGGRAPAGTHPDIMAPPGE